MSSEGKEADLDCTNSSRGVWLVKVPKYISQRWEKVPGNMDVGKLKITRNANRKLDITFSLSEAVIAMDTSETIPKEHKFAIGNVHHQTLGVFSRVPASSSSSILAESDKLCLEGKVIQRAECRPIGNSTYMKLKMQEFRKSAVPARTVKKLDDVVVVAPVSHHKNTFEPFAKKKVEIKKVRDDKDKVMGMLFAAFEKHQYYSLRHLVGITNQPVTYLKEILNEMCNYCMKKPHKSMYELKPEYRHYSNASPSGAPSADGDENSDDDD